MELELQVFNTELGSLCEIKSISKAKMGQVTKSAIKAIKMYKHVVQSVERFIAKCRPEQKVSGLYVIDSIVRQSRHQYGPEKDVFGPRFTRNFKQTFQNLFNTCPVVDKPKIVRVLNLWQLNNVFPADIIQPLLDMADPNAPIKVSDSPPTGSAGDSKEFVKHLHKLAHNLGVLKDKGKNGSGQDTRFNKKLLAYDYGDDDNLGGDEDDDDDEPRGETPTEAEPPVSETVAAVEREEESNDLATTISKNLLMNPELLQKLQQIQQLKQLQTSELSKSSSSSNFNNNGDSFRASEGSSAHNHRDTSAWSSNQRSHHEQSDIDTYRGNHYDRSNRRDKEPVSSPPTSSRRRRSRRSPSRSRSRSPRQRTRSDSRRDSYEKERPMSPETLARHKERERRRKGLPPVKEGHTIISSTTLWLGHVPKLISEDEIKDAFKEFGEIESIDLIPSRGCGYVLLKERSAAHKALQQNAKGFRLSGSNIKMAWAPGKGVKGKEYKDLWDLENGCTYIPHDLVTQLPVTQLDQLAEGGVIDLDSLPPQVRDTYEQITAAAAAASSTAATASNLTPDASEMERESNVRMPGHPVLAIDQVIPQFILPPPMRIPPPSPANMPPLPPLPTLPPLPQLPLLPPSLPPPPQPPHPSSGIMVDAFLTSLKNMPPPPPPPQLPQTSRSLPPAPPSVAMQTALPPQSSMPLFSNQPPPPPPGMSWPPAHSLPPPPPQPQVNSHLTGSNAQPLGLPQFNRSLFGGNLPPFPPSVLSKSDDQMRNSEHNSEDPFGPSAFELKAMERKKLPPHSLLPPHPYIHPPM